MVEQLDQETTTGIIYKFVNFTAKKILQLKLKLGMSINPFVDIWTIGPISDSLLSAINRSSQSARLSSGGTLEGRSPIERSDLTLEP